MYPTSISRVQRWKTRPVSTPCTCRIGRAADGRVWHPRPARPSRRSKRTTSTATMCTPGQHDDVLRRRRPVQARPLRPPRRDRILAGRRERRLPGPALKGRPLNAEGKYEPIPPSTSPAGVRYGTSKVVGLHLRLADNRLRFLDATTGKFPLTHRDSMRLNPNLQERSRLLNEERATSSKRNSTSPTTTTPPPKPPQRSRTHNPHASGGRASRLQACRKAHKPAAPSPTPPIPAGNPQRGSAAGAANWRR